MSNLRNEVDLFEAIDMWMCQRKFWETWLREGKLKSRRADGTIYFLREESMRSLIDRSGKPGRRKTMRDQNRRLEKPCNGQMARVWAI